MKALFLKYYSKETNGLSKKNEEEEEEEEETFEQDSKFAKGNNYNKQESWIELPKTFKKEDYDFSNKAFQESLNVTIRKGYYLSKYSV
ncbi:hypothetical protein C2G38_2220393 [Gigaspora rosea]|uniref:Uncharacterized protein n=1 Tax=Gigaspora rosea TaxID=44941 RepID=A0A397U4G7_9GLOM|nr:hypothetical protein C2G38_2220393 [Gigaspora rosea]